LEDATACYGPAMNASPHVGELLRQWRLRRHLSQLGLACEAEISSRHLSFVETGRSLPSREMLLHLSGVLDIPLRDRNLLLLAGGYAPVFKETPLEDSSLQLARQAVELVLAGHEPYPALAFDRHWTLVTENKAHMRLLRGVDAELLRPPVNVLRLALHPAGLAPRIVNLAEYRGYVFKRLRRDIAVTDDPLAARLLDEFGGYPEANGHGPTEAAATDSKYTGMVVRIQLIVDGASLSLFSASTVFGTPVDITLSELAIESYFPANQQTADTLLQWAASDVRHHN
jgi:transcriptional regulator with XRE-family HTH domain